MGMIQVLCFSLKPETDKAKYLAEQHARCAVKVREEGYEGYEIKTADETTFDELWDEQENLNKDARETYRQKMREGRCWFIEFDI